MDLLQMVAERVLVHGIDHIAGVVIDFASNAVLVWWAGRQARREGQQQ